MRVVLVVPNCQSCVYIFPISWIFYNHSMQSNLSWQKERKTPLVSRQLAMFSVKPNTEFCPTLSQKVICMWEVWLWLIQFNWRKPWFKFSFICTCYQKQVLRLVTKYLFLANTYMYWYAYSTIVLLLFINKGKYVSSITALFFSDH